MMKQTSRLMAAAAFALAALAPLGALAQAPAQPANTPADHAGHPGHTSALTAQAGQASAPAAALTDGEVRKIDKEAGKLTIRHGEIKHLEMPPMTMVFVAKDKALLDTVKAGDKIRFMVIEENGKMVVTSIEPAK